MNGQGSMFVKVTPHSPWRALSRKGKLAICQADDMRSALSGQRAALARRLKNQKVTLPTFSWDKA